MKNENLNDGSNVDNAFTWSIDTFDCIKSHMFHVIYIWIPYLIYCSEFVISSRWGWSFPPTKNSKFKNHVFIDLDSGCKSECSSNSECETGHACVDGQCCACAKEDYSLILRNLTFEVCNFFFKTCFYFQSFLYRNIPFFTFWFYVCFTRVIHRLIYT